jgi:hypothetical protein
MRGTTVPEDQPWTLLLRDALVLLALPPDEQERATRPGCDACDVLNDFDHARLVALGNAPDLSAEQCALLHRIDATMRMMQQPDFECFDKSVLRLPVWHQLRELATEALQEFGWKAVEVVPFVEIQPGVWQRSLGEGWKVTIINSDARP